MKLDKTKKICTKCGKYKKLSSFYRDVRYPYDKEKRICWCISCRNKYHYEYKTKYKDRTNLYIRKSNLKRSFGISIEEYDKLFYEQKGLCAMCGKKETARNKYGLKRLAVDHDHKTGKIRSLLCNQCNIGLGGFRDDIEKMLNAITYLRKHAAT